MSLPPARVNPSVLNGPHPKIQLTSTVTSSSINVPHLVIVEPRNNANQSYDPLLVAGISVGILQDPSQDSMRSPIVQRD